MPSAPQNAAPVKLSAAQGMNSVGPAMLNARPTNELGMCKEQKNVAAKTQTPEPVRLFRLCRNARLLPVRQQAARVRLPPPGLAAAAQAQKAGHWLRDQNPTLPARVMRVLSLIFDAAKQRRRIWNVLNI